MNFTILHKGVALFLAITVLFASVSITVEKHFCGETLVDMAVFSKAKKCSMGVSKDVQTQNTKTPCCKDEIEVLDNPQKMAQGFEEFTPLKAQMFVAYGLSLTALFASDQSSKISYNIYTPPLLVSDIQILHEVFII